ncbi:MAG TPA: hypothetical protein VGF30_15115 [Bacteroidia bacterium]
MDKKFLFITPLTPKRLLTPLRTMLFEQYIESLKRQSYKNWEALLIGEEDRTDGNIRYVSIAAESKEIKLIFAKEYILNMAQKPDYIIRIDDDDVINPNVLKRVANMDFDCYADHYHAFYDLTNFRISLQKRDWLANTVIHKYEHAMLEMGEDKIPLLQCDHSKDWIRYYKDKKLVYAPENSPVYLRVLSPTTVTSGIHGLTKNTKEKYDEFKSNVVKLHSAGDINFNQYHSYIRGFGKWKKQELPDFREQQRSLEQVWIKFYGKVPTEPFTFKLKRIWSSLKG